VGII
jgi:hypothetical protein